MHDITPPSPLKQVTLILLSEGKAEVLAQGDVFSPERFRSLVRDAGHAALDRDPDPTQAPKRRGNPGRAVEVQEVDEEVLLRYTQSGGPHPDDFERHRVFENLTALSLFLGLGPGACRAAHYYAKGKGKKEATVRGVTFMLVDDVAE